MYIELEVRRPGQDNWVKQAIDECLIEVVRPWFCCDGHGCLIYDRDDVILWQCKIPYRDLLAKLNGEEDEKQDAGATFRIDFAPDGEPWEWHPQPGCTLDESGAAFGIEARFVGGLIDTDSVRVVK